jgi:hypothetical protein
VVQIMVTLKRLPGPNTINHLDGVQQIRIENPGFEVNIHEPFYPQPLTDLVCALWSFQEKAEKLQDARTNHLRFPQSS